MKEIFPIGHYVSDLTKALRDRGAAPKIPLKTLPRFNEKIWGFKDGELVVVGARTSQGKCLGEGTEVLMYDGTIKKVENIRIGDEVMGPDSKPRKVIVQTIGTGKLYKIKQRCGDDYVTNGEHILSLKKTGNINYSKHNGKITSQRYSKGGIVNISVEDYISSSGKFKHIHKGYSCGVKFKSKKVGLDPYMLGLWLGDGTCSKPQITTNDKEIKDYITKWAVERNHLVKQYGKYDLSITRGHNKQKLKNEFLGMLRKYNVLNNKHIPREYLINSRKTRLSLLAGLIDSDGCLNHPSGLTFNNSNFKLVKEVVFLCKTLGYKAKISGPKKTSGKDAYRVNISSNNYSEIPLLLERKKPKKNSRECTTNNIEVTDIGYGKYYGFELSGDKLFLLGDCTVTHNSSFIGQVALDCVDSGIPVLLLSLEMGIEDTMERLFCNMFEIDNEILMKGKAKGNKSMRASYLSFKQWCEDAKFVITVGLGYTFNEVIDAIESLLDTEYAPKLVIVDYIQAIKTNAHTSREDMNEYIRKFRELALKHRFCGILCSQINRGAEMRKGDKPIMAQLKSTGNLEEHSDKVLLLHWEYFYTRNPEDKNKYEINVAKNRAGRTGSHEVEFYPQFYKFKEVKPLPHETYHERLDK